MIAVDTSALMAIIMDEATADDCIAALVQADQCLISAGTVCEALIVAERRGLGEEMNGLLSRVSFQIIAVTDASTKQVASAYALWGKGVHPAGLNICDCFSYALAKASSCPLLFVGNDFSKTDIASVF